MTKIIDLKQKAYSVIKQKIISCELLPGQDISETEIASMTGMSRTPVREALMRLEHERMINVYPRKGIVVSPLLIDMINDIFQIRLMIEPQILKAVSGILDVVWLKDMKEKFEMIDTGKADIFDCARTDKEFHSGLTAACGNAYLSSLMDNIYDHDQRIRIMSSRNKSRLSLSNMEHQGIIEELINEDIDAAAVMLMTHLENARESALKLGR